MTDDILNNILAKVVNIEEQLHDFATKEDLQIAKNEILGDVDRFIKLHETLDHELVSLRHKYERLEERIQKLEMNFVNN